MVLESNPPEKRITAGALGLRGAKELKAADNEDITNAYFVAEISR
jgi:hypothetical protein